MIVEVKLYDIKYDIEENDALRNFDDDTQEAIKEHLEKARELTITLGRLGDTHMSVLLETIDLMQQNSEPTILITDINLTKNDIAVIGRNKDTLRFQVNGVTYIKFFAKDLIEKINRIDGVMRLTIVGTANLNEWNFKITPQVLIKDLDIEEVGYDLLF